MSGDQPGLDDRSSGLWRELMDRYTEDIPIRFTGHGVNDAGDLVLSYEVSSDIRGWVPKATEEWMMELEGEIRLEQEGNHQDGRRFCMFCEDDLLYRVNGGETEFKEQVVLQWDSYDERYHLAREHCFVCHAMKRVDVLFSRI